MFGQFDITISKSKLEDIKSIYGNNLMELLSDFFYAHNTFSSEMIKSLKSFNQKKSSDSIQLKIAGFIPLEAWDGILRFCQDQRVSTPNFANWALQLIWENDMGSKPVNINSSLKIKPAAKTASSFQSKSSKADSYWHNQQADKLKLKNKKSPGDKNLKHNQEADKYFGE